MAAGRYDPQPLDDPNPDCWPYPQSVDAKRLMPGVSTPHGVVTNVAIDCPGNGEPIRTTVEFVGGDEVFMINGIPKTRTLEPHGNIVWPSGLVTLKANAKPFEASMARATEGLHKLARACGLKIREQCDPPPLRVCFSLGIGKLFVLRIVR